MHDRVQPGVEEDHPSRHFVEVDVVVERQHLRKAHIPQPADEVPQDQREDKGRVEVEAEPAGPRSHVEVVRPCSVAVVPGAANNRRIQALKYSDNP